MIEALDISEAMKSASKNEVDKLFEMTNERIQRAVSYGRTCCCFPVDKDNSHYSEVRAAYEAKGYKIKPTGYIGGVWQLTEDICW